VKLNVGSQNAQIINNADTQVIHGGQHVGSPPPEVLDAVEQLQALLRNLPVDPSTAARARAELDDAGRQLRAPEPDRAAVDRSLSRFVEALTRVASPITALAGLVTPLSTLAGWIGAQGGLLAGALGALL
jgi:hypothetical protein